MRSIGEFLADDMGGYSCDRVLLTRSSYGDPAWQLHSCRRPYRLLSKLAPSDSVIQKLPWLIFYADVTCLLGTGTEPHGPTLTLAKPSGSKVSSAGFLGASEDSGSNGDLRRKKQACDHKQPCHRGTLVMP